LICVNKARSLLVTDGDGGDHVSTVRQTDRETDRQTDRHTDRNTPHPSSIAYTKRGEDVSQFGGSDESLSLAVECLERLHEVGERSDVSL